jgi:hypothetical protein
MGKGGKKTKRQEENGKGKREKGSRLEKKHWFGETECRF